VSLSFVGTVVLEERDDEAHRIRLNARGMEQRGKGAASAVVVSQLEQVDGGTKVSMETDLTITGAVAQYGRGMMLDISQRLTREFAQCLEASIMVENPEEVPRDAEDAKLSTQGL
jgi:carbon monoxide dehydrogenase subunit G